MFLFLNVLYRACEVRKDQIHYHDGAFFRVQPLEHSGQVQSMIYSLISLAKLVCPRLFSHVFLQI